MTWIYVVLIVGFVAGIIYFNSQAPAVNKSQRELLDALAKYLDGTVNPILDQEDALRVDFRFKQISFVYEDVGLKGFKEKIYRGVLKCSTQTPLTLYFTQKEAKTTMRSDIVISSNISSDDVSVETQISLPKDFNKFMLHTNDKLQAKRFLENPKVIKVFREFINTDKRGYALVTLKLAKGEIFLDFHPARDIHPNRLEMLNNIPSIENYLKKLIEIAQFLK